METKQNNMKTEWTKQVLDADMYYFLLAGK